MPNNVKNSANKVIGGKPMNGEKLLLINKIKSGRNELIERGVPINDPLILEISKIERKHSKETH